MPQEENRNALTTEELAHVAIQRVNEFDTLSNLPSDNGSVLSLDWTHVQVGSLLGTGTFAAVYQVQLKNTQEQPQNDEKTADESSLLAIKVLRPDVLAKENKGQCLAGAVDMAIEARILASLQHENIITLHGVNAGSFEESLQACDGFLVLDYLIQTLGQFLTQERLRLEERIQSAKWYTMSDKMALTKRSKRRHFDAGAMHERVETIAKSIARAMEYMHSHGILFRDLKPANCGFDGMGRIKIFDLGLARPLHCIEIGRPVGSPRYMAPEVAICQNYGLPADVYSFGILLHEICTLQKPFADMVGSRELRQRVAYGHERPPLNEIGNNRSLRMLLQACWQSSPRSRPSFTTVLSELNKLQQQRRFTEFASSSMNVSKEGQVFADDASPRRGLTYLRPSRQSEGGKAMKHFWRKVTLFPAARQEEEEMVFSH